jgi:hypothetical protein
MIVSLHVWDMLSKQGKLMEESNKMFVGDVTDKHIVQRGCLVCW